MVFEFKLPDIGEGVHEGEIAKWLVQTGDAIREDQPMVEVMTDKVTVEITAPVAGTVQSLLAAEGDVVAVGKVIITIAESNAAASPTRATTAVAAESRGGGVSVSAPPASPPSVFRPGSSPEKVLAAPAVRRLAREMGVDLAAVTGSGPQGRIRKADLAGFTTPPSGARRPQSQSTAVPVSRPEERLPYRGMRRKIGDHLVHAKHTAPHFTYVEEADMTDVVKLRQDLDEPARERGIKLTYLPFILKAVIQGLKQYPNLNSSLDEERQEIVRKFAYNLGVAVATPDGLIVPVIHHADRLSLLELAARIADLGKRAREGKLALTDLQGGTFTLTSIGSIGGIFSAPIINYPEVAIMGIQKIEKRPVVRDDQVVIREMTYFSISCDHRVVDGAEAALFMKTMIDHLTHPARLFLEVL